MRYRDSRGRRTGGRKLGRTGGRIGRHSGSHARIRLLRSQQSAAPATVDAVHRRRRQRILLAPNPPKPPIGATKVGVLPPGVVVCDWCRRAGEGLRRVDDTLVCAACWADGGGCFTAHVTCDKLWSGLSPA